jgi:uncharacterized membrane protein
MHIKRYLIAGVLIWVPVGLVIAVLGVMVDLADRTLLLLPEAYQPDAFLGFHIPGFGILLTFSVLLITGFVVTNYFGRKLVHLGEAILSRIPVVRSLYNGAKQVMETMLSDKGSSFNKVLLVQYPKEDIWSIAFQTNENAEEVQARTGDEVVCAFIPTTPNPTSGFLVMLPKKDVIEMEMSVDDALKMIISLGVVVPDFQPPDDIATTRAANPGAGLDGGA